MIYETSYLLDKKANCHSYLCTVDLQWYLDITEQAYKNDGGIEGQRAALGTQVGRRIRRQMMEDFKAGSILPPVVIGIEHKDAPTLNKISKDELTELILKSDAGDICILDGMQRTTAMKEALSELLEGEQFKNTIIRVEFWISEKIHSLLYRMLVLNTGQVPWSLRRQVEVVFHSLKKEMQTRVSKLSLIEVNDGSRRVRPGAFHADKLIELFLITGTRSERIDVKEKLADDFLKLDFIENASDKELTEFYFEILNIIVDFDFALHGGGVEYAEGRFCRGIDLFSSQPALSGFCVAVAQHVFGRPGVTVPLEKQRINLQMLKSGFKNLIQKINYLTPSQLQEFCSFEVLNEQISPFKKSAKIGDEERNYFKNAFKVIIEENFNIESLQVCWRV